ncbi:MAG: MFS transporter [Candidatus Acidiferrales bacterium]
MDTTVEYSKRYEKTLVAILFFTWGTVFLDRMSELYLAPYFAPVFHLNDQQIGFLASAVSIAWAIGALFFGALSDRIGRRKILIPGVLCFSALSWLSGFVHSFHELLLLRALIGLVEGPCWVAISALVEESSAPSRRGRNVGIVVSGAALVGLFAAPILTTQIASRFGWRWGFFVTGVPGLVMALLIWKYVKEAEPSAAGAALRKRGVPISHYLSVLRYRNVWLCAIGAGGFISWLFLQNTFAPLLITRNMHQDPRTAGFLLGAAGLGSFFIGLGLPSLSDRIGRKPMLLILAVLSSFLPLALLVRPLYGHLWLLAAILFLTQGGQAIAALVIVLIPAESVPPELTGTGIGVANLVGELIGATIAPTLGGTLAESHGLDSTMLMATGGTILLFLTVLFMKETAGSRAHTRAAERGDSTDVSAQARDA